MDPAQIEKLFAEQLSGGGKNLNLTKEEEERMKKSFKDPEFMKLFSAFAQELSTEQGKMSIDQEIKKMEEYAESKAFVEGEQIRQMEESAKRPVIQKKDEKLTAHQKKIAREREVAIQALEKKQKQDQEQKAKIGEQMKKMSEMQKELKDLEEKKKAVDSFKPGNMENQAQMTAEDYQKLDQLLQQAKDLGIATESNKKASDVDKIMEKLAGPKEEVVEKKVTTLPSEVIYVQDVQYGDYIQDEKLNVNAARGYKSIQVRLPIPDDAIKETMKLEIEKNIVKYSCETPTKKFIMERKTDVTLKQRESQAKLRNFDAQAAEKVGCKQFLEVTVNIDNNSEQSVQYYMNQIKEIKHVETGKVVEKLEEPEIDSIPEPKIELSKPSIEVPDFIKEQSQKWEQVQSQAAPVVAVSKESQKSFNELYKEQQQKKQKKFDVNDIDAGLQVFDKTGVEFVFRGKVFGFSNPDLVDALQ
ncbi:Conserved_hypothetical protein [Hexamita inflata]|uniref:Uncharacterized protein n=1 Tax=Hexamita inflata TaxID=28002 RepID=A0AA86R5E9_9EUKA|nr:Conserved hypothetical protein [Hexamita inflata]